MGMLAIIDRLAESRLALLEKQRDRSAGHGCRLQAEHGSECELASPDLALRHGHEPVGGKNLVITARPGLLHARLGMPRRET